MLKLTYLILAILTWTHGTCTAETLEVRYLQALAHAQSSEEVQNLNTAYSHLKVAGMACKIQLREERVPVACYEFMTLQRKYGIKTSALKDSERLRRLDELCFRAAEKLNLGPGEEPFVSPACAKKIQESHAIQEYRGEQSDTWSEY